MGGESNYEMRETREKGMTCCTPGGVTQRLKREKGRERNMKKFGLTVWLEAIGLAALMMVLSVQATSFDLVPLGVQDMARYGATHVLDVKYSDWVGYTGSTNTTAVNTNALPLGAMVKFVMMILNVLIRKSY